MRFSRCWPALALVLAVVLAVWGSLGCSTPQSFIVLLLESSPPITGVDRIGVAVSQGATQMKTLTYPAGNLTIVADGSINMGTLSVGFTGDQTGDVMFEVTAFDAHGCGIGKAQGTASIIKGATNELTLHLRAEVSCTGDAGAPDLQPDSGFPGCDPATLSCPTGQSCQVDCQDRSDVCAVAGSSGPGGSCAGDAGCAPGTQCFDYTSLGCKGTQICLQFCAGDTECAAQGQAGGVGPGSFCRDPVACGGVTTAYHTCTFSCDPTAAAATAASTGCPAGLACVIPSSMDHVDCTCPESTRTGKENATCTSTAECAPGFLCEQTCRAVCRCDAKSGACTAANDCPTSGTTCTPVPNQTIYGVCLP